MGIEPTNRMFSIRLNGFEDRGLHQQCFHFHKLNHSQLELGENHRALTVNVWSLRRLPFSIRFRPGTWTKINRLNISLPHSKSHDNDLVTALGYLFKPSDTRETQCGKAKRFNMDSARQAILRGRMAREMTVRAVPILESPSPACGQHGSQDSCQQRARDRFGNGDGRQAINTDIVSAVTTNIELEGLDIGEVQPREIIEKELVISGGRSRLRDGAGTVGVGGYDFKLCCDISRGDMQGE